MEPRFNKPRVFLSHCRKDEKFVERLQNDLRKCQIESWRDQTDIRDGQPWLDAIFEDGIPTCDAILAYFTPDALKSKMVGKEVDAAILRRLKDSKIAFLPYVSREAVREALRVDIQTLYCREWNRENYHEILPSIVAEIWRSYLERTVETATTQERVRRLELEIEVKRLSEIQDERVFSPHENAELEYIRRSLDVTLRIHVAAHAPNSQNSAAPGEKVGEWHLNISLLRRVIQCWGDNFLSLNPTLFLQPYEDTTLEDAIFPHKGDFYIGNVHESKEFDFLASLMKFGLIERNPTDHFYNYLYTAKMNRFMFWLEYNKIVSDLPVCTYEGFVSSETSSRAQ